MTDRAAQPDAADAGVDPDTDGGIHPSVLIDTDGGIDAALAADLRRPGPLRGPSARAHLLFVLGEYALDRTGGAWTQTVVDALAVVGFEEKAARQALTRSAAAGWLTPERSGRRVRWQITPVGQAFLTAARDRLFAPGPDRDWDGDWLVLLTTVPESMRRLRHRLRTSLGWAGFGSLGPGVWISPHPSHADEARQVLRSLGDQVQGTLLHARLDDPAERHRLVAQAWDVSELDTQYAEFIDRFAAARPRTPADALAQLVHLCYQWRRLLLLDPGLPPTLLPADWIGEPARALLLDRHAAWHELAQPWWDAREGESSTTED
jgi:phenylacetic acid degradation operon negative regulatory protein